MGNKSVPLVSISVITYNHEKYIRQCLDGILMQKVNFPYEILVHDDASPDGTADIIREYEAKYPGIIKPIYQTENQYSQGKPVSKFNFDRARGKYLAFCEGDDYWTDPGKLQKQVDFLERHPEYIATAHRVKAINEHGEILDISGYTDVVEHVFTIDEYLNPLYPGTLPSQLASLVMRNVFLTLDPHIRDLFYSCNALGDQKLSLLLVMMGDIYCFSEDMTTYRYITSEGTSWSAQVHSKNLSYVIYKQYLALQQLAYEAFDFELPASPLYNALFSALVKAVRHPNRSNFKILLDIAIDVPNKRSMVLYHLSRMPNYIERIVARAKTHLKIWNL
ncbi:MAG: glycosyltransferase family 2 protein [Fastidiosipilaceae bacterium]